MTAATLSQYHYRIGQPRSQTNSCTENSPGEVSHIKEMGMTPDFNLKLSSCFTLNFHSRRLRNTQRHNWQMMATSDNKDAIQAHIIHSLEQKARFSPAKAKILSPTRKNKERYASETTQSATIWPKTFKPRTTLQDQRNIWNDHVTNIKSTFTLLCDDDQTCKRLFPHGRINRQKLLTSHRTTYVDNSQSQVTNIFANMR